MSELQHLVLFRFPGDLSPEDEKEMFAQVSAWPEKIGGFTRLRLGKDVSGRSRGYQYALMVEFEDEEAAKRYHPHPVHQVFAGWVADRGCEVLALDYPLDSSTRILDG
jgi:heme-degrading monooxygenase HmoA